MEQLIRYLRTMFGPQMFLEDYNRYDNLPLYLTENYQLFSLQIGEERYLLVKPKTVMDLRMETLKKQLKQIQKYTNLLPVLLLENLRLNQRNALVQSGIAFLVPEKQLYIPHCAMNLTETESVAQEYGEQFAVATQVVFIYLLLNKIKKTNAHQLSEWLPYSVASVNRALKELSFRELLRTEGSSTRKQYTISSGREFWEKGKQYLFDPVKTRHYVAMKFDNPRFLMSGDLALFRLSFLNGTSIHSYAASAQDFQKIEKAKILHVYDVFDRDYCVIEIFRYDPKMLASGNYVDVCSLYAQFKDSKDERVQIEIEGLVNEILW